MSLGIFTVLPFPVQIFILNESEQQNNICVIIYLILMATISLLDILILIKVLSKANKKH